MRAIREIKDIICEQFVTALNGAIDNMRDKKIPDAQVFNIVIQALAFKYWHENCSCHVNSTVDGDDFEYVRVHWKLFCSSEIGKVVRQDESLICVADDVDVADVVKVLGVVSDYITYRHYNADNVDVLSQVKIFLNAQHDDTLRMRFEGLKKIYGRATDTGA